MRIFVVEAEAWVRDNADAVADAAERLDRPDLAERVRRLEDADG